MTVSTKPLAVPNTVDMSTPLLTKELCRSSAHGVVPTLVSNSSGFVRWLTLSKGWESCDATVKWMGIIGSVNLASSGHVGLSSQICAVTIRKRLPAAPWTRSRSAMCVWTWYDSVTRMCVWYVWLGCVPLEQWYTSESYRLVLPLALACRWRLAWAAGFFASVKWLTLTWRWSLAWLPWWSTIQYLLSYPIDFTFTCSTRIRHASRDFVTIRGADSALPSNIHWHVHAS